MPHITQIAATEPASKSTFDTYIIPTLPISLEAQQITGIAKNWIIDNGCAWTVCPDQISAK